MTERPAQRPPEEKEVSVVEELASALGDLLSGAWEAIQELLAPPEPPMTPVPIPVRSRHPYDRR